MIADDANPERRTLWSVLAWLEQWQGIDLNTTISDAPGTAADFVQQEARSQIEKIKRTLENSA